MPALNGDQFLPRNPDESYARGGRNWDPGLVFGDLSGAHFKYGEYPVLYNRGQTPAGSGRHHRLEMHNSSGASVGQMEWHVDSGRIERLHVDPRYRRLGVATAMNQEANRLADVSGIASPQHSEQRTVAGDAWARSVGGHMPELQKVAALQPGDEEWPRPEGLPELPPLPDWLK